MAKTSAKGSGKTPGAVLEKYIADYGLAVSSVALMLGQNAVTFKKILEDKKRITVELALLLAKLFGTTADFWIDLQKKAALTEAKNDSKLQNRLKDLKKASKQEKGAKAKQTATGKKPGRKPGRKPAAAKVVSATKTGKKPGRKPGRKPATASNGSSSSSSDSTSSW
jgi:addiction module HigA family antidote